MRLSAKPWATKGVQERNAKGGNALHVAVGTGNIDGTADLLQFVEVDLNVPNARGQNPLDIAQKNNQEIARVLVQHGASKSATWNGQSGRDQGTNVRARSQGASAARQQRAAKWSKRA